MIPPDDLGILQWQCAYIYVCRRRKGLSLTQAELNVLMEMRTFFRADRNPPKALVDRARALLTAWKARRKGLLQKRPDRTSRRSRLEAAESRREAAGQKAKARRIASWRTELHKEAYD